MLHNNPNDSINENANSETKLSDTTSSTQIISSKIDMKEISNRETLHEGSFTIVYRALWKNKKSVALKVSKSSQTKNDIISEFKLLEKLSPTTPNIVPFWGGSNAFDNPYIITTYLPNESLFKYIKENKKIDWTSSISMMRDITVGIAGFHAKKIVHRDIKSANIFLDEKLHAYIGDFGSAREYKEGSCSYQSPLSHATGTPGWIAPESYQHQIYSDKSDIYSLGTVIWEISSRRLPFHDAREKKMNTIFEIKYITLQSKEPEKIPEGTLKGIAKLIRWCWEKKPKDRPTEIQILSSLDECLAEYKKTHKSS